MKNALEKELQTLIDTHGLERVREVLETISLTREKTRQAAEKILHVPEEKIEKQRTEKILGSVERGNEGNNSDYQMHNKNGDVLLDEDSIAKITNFLIQNRGMIIRQYPDGTRETVGLRWVGQDSSGRSRFQVPVIHITGNSDMYRFLIHMSKKLAGSKYMPLPKSEQTEEIGQTDTSELSLREALKANTGEQHTMCNEILAILTYGENAFVPKKYMMALALNASASACVPYIGYLRKAGSANEKIAKKGIGVFMTDEQISNALQHASGDCKKYAAEIRTAFGDKDARLEILFEKVSDAGQRKRIAEAVCRKQTSTLSPEDAKAGHDWIAAVSGSL